MRSFIASPQYLAGFAGTLAALAAAVVAVSSCDRPPNSKWNGEPVPRELCDISFTGLDRMVSLGEGQFTYDRRGHATIDDAAWGQIPWANKTDLAKMLAYADACTNGGDPNAKLVTIRSARTNKKLAQGFVATFSEE